MRIVAGQHKGRKLHSPEGYDTRPTSDRARQAVFNILAHAGWLDAPLPEGAFVLDAFAGTGALGLEALSRGAAQVVFIESAPAAHIVCQKNIAACKAENNTTLLRTDVLKIKERAASIVPRNLVFLDPPYGKNLGVAALAALEKSRWIADNCVLVMEMAKANPEPLPQGWTIENERSYGVALVRFLTRN